MLGATLFGLPYTASGGIGPTDLHLLPRLRVFYQSSALLEPMRGLHLSRATPCEGPFFTFKIQNHVSSSMSEKSISDH